MTDKQFASGRRKVTGRLSLGQERAKPVVIKDAKGRAIRGTSEMKKNEPTLVMLEVIGQTGKLKLTDSVKRLGRTGSHPGLSDDGKRRTALSKWFIAAHTRKAKPIKPRVERSAVTDFQAEADRLGIPLGAPPTDDEARARLRAAAADATDLFANPEAALTYLTSQPLGGRGRNGAQILREKGLPGVLSALDHKRFGPRG